MLQYSIFFHHHFSQIFPFYHRFFHVPPIKYREMAHPPLTSGTELRGSDPFAFEALLPALAAALEARRSPAMKLHSLPLGEERVARAARRFFESCC